jgi:hypothetical protein
MRLFKKSPKPSWGCLPLIAAPVLLLVWLVIS